MATKLPSGSYRAAVFMGHESGKRKYESFTAPTAKEADYLALRFAIENKRSVVGNLSIKEMVEGYISAKSNVLSPSTIRSYKTLQRNSFANIEMLHPKAITNEVVQKWVNKLATELSPKTVRNAHGLLSTVFKMYMPDFSLHTTLPKKLKTEIIILDDKGMNELLQRVSGTDMELPVKLAAFMGLRRSEVCALTWGDLNIKDKTATIRHAIVLDSDNNVVEKAPKTKKGHRTLPIPDIVVSILFDGKKHEAKERVTNIRIGKITKYFCEREGCTYHSLRHYYASKLLQLGVPNKYAIDLLGHETDNMLKQVYQHLFADKMDEIRSTISTHFNAVFADVE